MKAFGTIILQLPEELGEEKVMHFSIVKAESARVTVPVIKQSPPVETAIWGVIKAITRLENSQHTRDEQPAMIALQKASRQLRFVFNRVSFPKKG